MISLETVKDRCWTDKKEVDRQYFFTFYFYRPVSFRLSQYYLNKGLSADAATFHSLVCLLVAVPLLFVENMLLNTVAVLLILGWGVLDCVDGNIARFTGEYTKRGHFYDTLVGYFAYVVVFYMPQFIQDDNGIFGFSVAAVLCSLSTMAYLFSRLCHQKYLNLEFSKGESKYNYIEAPAAKSGGFIQLYNNIATFNGVLPLILLLAVLAQVVHFYIVFFFFINVSVCFFYVFRLVRQAAWVVE